MKHFNIILIAGLLVIAGHSANAQQWNGKFEQLGQMLPTPNGYRSGSGAPGVDYWQQREIGRAHV